MPVTFSQYRSPWWLANGHLQTLLQIGRRLRSPLPVEHREVTLPDGDFVDVEISRPEHAPERRRVAVVTHGLEGSSRAIQSRALAAHLRRHGWEVWSWSFRSCSGRHNRLPVIYHSACTPDLHAVLRAALEEREAATTRAALVGYSLGGNLILRYLGERGGEVDPRVRCAATYSVPVDLAAAAAHLDREIPWCIFYREGFLRSLRARVRWRRPFLPPGLPYDRLDDLRTFRAFDDAITAPLHGFGDAVSYYDRASSKAVLRGIRVPTLVLNSADDPLLPPPCYPWSAAEANPDLTLEYSRHGGHCGFFPSWPGQPFWIERRVVDWLEAPKSDTGPGTAGTAPGSPG
ncbi:MAG: alpha/beta fold hydrolase [Verrucomicrobiota bacterium]